MITCESLKLISLHIPTNFISRFLSKKKNNNNDCIFETEDLKSLPQRQPKWVIHPGHGVAE